ncbi:hypothetical protein [Clostridium perfringens]|uniref:hypothetical protein n=1 Tax=Clostridium perfringens TaxID=1502 RepID=UPI0022455423|nr:hypothetical protein [Clostridium perfringens]EJT5920850.1 hypothetical protein [Clostridium perfringens]EJT5920960.1 hypothetical protein [Clostridium perfringens]MCX0403357.1 hypothetical protein [Clostridium perfringens]MDM0947476.1 hypothetical protein [Clostridium perfringens]
MSKKNNKNKAAIIYKNGKTGGQCYKDFLAWKEKKSDENYIDYLIKSENLDRASAAEINNVVLKRFENNNENKKFDKENDVKKKSNKKKKRVGRKDKELKKKDRKLLKKIEDNKKTVKIGKPSTNSTYKKLDKEFNRFLVKEGYAKDTHMKIRGSDKINELFNKFISNNSKMSENTKNAHKSAFNFMQENKYQINTKGNKTKKAMREINRKRNNSKLNIEIPQDKLKLFEENLNHIDKTFRSEYSGQAKGKQAVFREKTCAVNYTKWFIGIKGGSYIKNSTLDDYKEFSRYMESIGYATETKYRHTTALRKYSVKGNWDAKLPKSNKELGIERRVNAVIDRAWRSDEFTNAFKLAVEGTCKKGGGKRPDVALYMLSLRVFGERINECLNMTTEQFKSVVDNKYLELTKTKGKVPRVLQGDILGMHKKTFKMFEPLIKYCEEAGIEKPFIEVWDRNSGKKTHNIKQTYTQWINRHRSKFQHEDRYNKDYLNQKNKGKSKNDIKVEKAYLTAHGLRHSDAQDIFNMCVSKYTKLSEDNAVKNDYLNRYKKEKMALAKKRGYKFIWDNNKEDKLLEEYITKLAAKTTSRALGHQREAITKTYLVRKMGDGSSVAIDMDSLDMYNVIFKDGELTIEPRE